MRGKTMYIKIWDESIDVPRWESEKQTAARLKRLEEQENRRFNKFITEFTPGDYVINAGGWERDRFYLGHTFDKWILVIGVGDGWAASKVHLVRVGNFYRGDRGRPKKHSTLVCSKSQEEIDLLVARYCRNLKSQKRKHFITTLSNQNNGIMI